MPIFALRPLPGALLLLPALTLVTPAGAETSHRPKSLASPRPSLSERIGLYAPRFRRSTQTYLRLRLLELREADLDRARAVIERRLDINALLGDPPSDPRDARRRNITIWRTY